MNRSARTQPLVRSLIDPRYQQQVHLVEHRGSARLPRTFGPAAVLTCLVALTLAPGCADTRISLDEYNRIELEATQVAPVELAASQLALTEVRPYTVGPGDVLNVTLTGLSDQFSQTMLQLRVHDDGTVMLPMAGKVKVQGLDLKAVEETLYEAHVPTFVRDMSVFVHLGGPETTTVLVVGAAGESGLVRLPRNERNVLYALSRAAGFGATGNGRVRVQPVRPDRPEFTYDLTDINDLRRALLAPPLESGDMVVVQPAELNAIFRDRAGKHPHSHTRRAARQPVPRADARGRRWIARLPRS